MSKAILYMVMDGRASYDFDAAMCLETIEAHSDKKALKEAKINWDGYDVSLFRVGDSGEPFFVGYL